MPACSPAASGSATACPFWPGDGGDASDGKVTAISVFAEGTAVRRDSVHAGRIARLSGLAGIQVGDEIGTASECVALAHAPRDVGDYRGL